jgi:hypothetical protein
MLTKAICHPIHLYVPCKEKSPQRRKEPEEVSNILPAKKQKPFTSYPPKINSQKPFQNTAEKHLDCHLH